MNKIKYNTLAEYLEKEEFFDLSKIEKHFRKPEVTTIEEQFEFIQNHFTYSTMNSWNRVVNPANNVKLDNLNIPTELRDKAYEFIGNSETFESINDIFNSYAIYNNYKFQLGFNGRSGGYIVIYKSDKILSDYKSYCTNCGQKNFKTIEESGKICGKCKSESRINKNFYQIVTYTGQSILFNSDNIEDYSEYEIKSLYEIISEFDLICDVVRHDFINTLKNNEIVEEEIMEPKKVKVIKPLNIED